jgi:hypothetical protein
MTKNLLFVLLLLSGVSQAQTHRFMFHLGANRVMLPAVETHSELSLVIPVSTGISYYKYPITVRQEFSGKVGFDLGAKADVALTDRFFITTGLQASFVRYRKSITIEDFPPVEYNGTVINGVPAGSVVFEPVPSGNNTVTLNSGGDGNTSLWYGQIPVMAGTSFLHSKLVVRAGAMFSLLAYASENKTRYSLTAPNTTEAYKDTDKSAYHTFQAGAAVDATYFIWPWMGIDLSFDHSLTSLYGDQSKPRMSTVSLGLNYCIGK